MFILLTCERNQGLLSTEMDFIAGRTQAPAENGWKKSRTKHFESKHTVMGSVQAGRMGEEVAREVMGGQEMLCGGFAGGSQFQEKGGDSQGDAIHLEGRGERIEKALETRSWRAWKLDLCGPHQENRMVICAGLAQSSIVDIAGGEARW